MPTYHTCHGQTSWKTTRGGAAVMVSVAPYVVEVVRLTVCVAGVCCVCRKRSQSLRSDSTEGGVPRWVGAIYGKRALGDSEQ